MALRDTIAAAQDRRSELVEVPEWGVTVKVLVPTLAERSKLIEHFMAMRDEENTDFSGVYITVLTAMLADPETDEPVFTEDDRDLILSKSGEVAQRLFDICQRVGGLLPEAAKELVDEGKDA